ncbi:MAG: FixH family protein [Chloroflexi bacterium]|nr:FixH family protein [Chloroflexota bacterium]
MKKTTFQSLAVLWLITILLLTPTLALADSGSGGIEGEVNGYHVKLVFTEPVKVGENQFHIQIADTMGMPVSNAEVEVSAMPVEGMEEMEMATEAPSVGVMTSNNSMSEMDMGSETPEPGVMQPVEPEAGHDEEATTVMLEPGKESGEYEGELHLDKSGEWMFNVHFTVNGKTNVVDLPFEVSRKLGLNYAVLAGFFGINATAISAAAISKRKSIAQKA